MASSNPLAPPAGFASPIKFVQKMLGDELSPMQETLLRAIYGMPMDAMQESLYANATERKPDWRARPWKSLHDVAVVVGRRGGKTGRIGVPIAVYECLLGGHQRYLGRGERGHVVIMAQTLRAANETMALAKYKIGQSKELLAEVVDDQKKSVGLAQEIAFKNGMVLSIWPCSFTAIRGLHIPVCIMDEVGMWDVEGVNPDKEIVRAVRPAGATFPRRLLLKLSTPWAKAGVLWEDFDTWYGKDGGPLVWHATTRDMNPTIEIDFLIQEFNRDPEASRREYDAIFVDAQAAFLPEAAINAAVDHGVTERPRDKRRQYFGALDVAFKNDAMVLTIGHRDLRQPGYTSWTAGPDEERSDRVVVDIWRQWKPPPGGVLDAEVVLKEVALEARFWGVRTLWGDQYASEPVRALLRRHGVSFIEVTWTNSRVNTVTPDNRRKAGASKQDLYGNMKTLLLQDRLSLLDNPTGLKELRGLEVKRTWGGYEQIGAPPGQHDDFPASLAMMCWQAWKAPVKKAAEPTATWVGPTIMDWRIESAESQEDLPPALRDPPTAQEIGIGGGLAYYVPRKVESWP